MVPDEVTLHALSPVDARYHRYRFAGDGDVLAVTFSGDYRDGSGGAPDARAMAAHVAAGVTAWAAAGVVLDLSALAYRWGNNLIDVLVTASVAGDVLLPRPTAIVTGPGSRDGLASLCAPAALFATVADAVAAVHVEARTRDAELARTERELQVAIAVRDDLSSADAMALAACGPSRYLEFVPHDWRTITWRIEGGAALVVRATAAQLVEVAAAAPAHVIADPGDRHQTMAVVLGARVELPAMVQALPRW